MIFLFLVMMMQRALRLAVKPTRSSLGTTMFTAKRGYHENVVDHYENPRNVGTLDKKKTNVGTGLVGAPGKENATG